MLASAAERTHLSEVETGAVAAVVVIPVHVQDLLALDGQQTGQDTLRQASTKHDVLHQDLISLKHFLLIALTYIILFIHSSSSDVVEGGGFVKS